MSQLLKQLQLMYEKKLYTNLVQVLTVLEQKPETLSLLQKLQVQLIYADSLYYTQNYHKAETVARQALQLRNHLVKSKATNGDVVSEVEICLRIHKCCLALKRHNAAVGILESISTRSRDAEVNMALGNLYRDSGMYRSAIHCYKEVLTEFPLALDAVNNLLKLGVKGVEVNELMVDVTNDSSWLHLWVKAQIEFFAKDFSNAIISYQNMDVYGMLRDNSYVLVNLGYCYHYLHQSENAIGVLQRAIRLGQNLTFGRDLLATLLAASGTSEHVQNLKKLIPDTDLSLWSEEHWVALGCFSFVEQKFQKAGCYAEKVLSLSNRKNVEALLLKAKCELELGCYKDAAQFCLEGIQICGFRYDLHQCLVECYVKMNRLREAETMASNACKQLNYSPQSLTLHASVLLKDPLTANKTVQKILEKAITEDKKFSTDAIYLLAEVFKKQQQHEQACELLQRYKEKKPTSRLYQMLADSLVNLQKYDEAFDHYMIALNLDPNNHRATEGIDCIESNLRGVKRGVFATPDFRTPLNSTSEDEVLDQNEDALRNSSV